jgi:hypothetical protein
MRSFHLSFGSAHHLACDCPTSYIVLFPIVALLPVMISSVNSLTTRTKMHRSLTHRQLIVVLARVKACLWGHKDRDTNASGSGAIADAGGDKRGCCCRRCSRRRVLPGPAADSEAQPDQRHVRHQRKSLSTGNTTTSASGERPLGGQREKEDEQAIGVLKTWWDLTREAKERERGQRSSDDSSEENSSSKQTASKKATRRRSTNPRRLSSKQSEAVKVEKALYFLCWRVRLPRYLEIRGQAKLEGDDDNDDDDRGGGGGGAAGPVSKVFRPRPRGRISSDLESRAPSTLRASLLEVARNGTSSRAMCRLQAKVRAGVCGVGVNVCQRVFVRVSACVSACVRACVGVSQCLCGRGSQCLCVRVRVSAFRFISIHVVSNPFVHFVNFD